VNPQNKAEETEDKHKRYRAIFEGWLMVSRKNSGEINYNTTNLTVPAPKGPFTIDLFKSGDKWAAELLPVKTKFKAIKLNKDRQVVASTIEGYFEKKVSDWVAIAE
jgi:hypothetical protein